MSGELEPVILDAVESAIPSKMDAVLSQTLQSINDTKQATASLIASLAGQITALSEQVASVPRGIKSVQRGEASAAGDITINAVNPSTTFVQCFSTGSAGYVAARGNFSGILKSLRSGGSTGLDGTWKDNDLTMTGTLSGGSTDLTAAAFGVYLKNATTLTATGPCRYEVVEFH